MAIATSKAGPLIASLVFCAVSATAAISMDRGQFANVPPEVRDWFERLRSPDGVPCCSYADGHRTGYDMRQGQYWVPIEGEWCTWRRTPRFAPTQNIGFFALSHRTAFDGRARGTSSISAAMRQDALRRTLLNFPTCCVSECLELLATDVE